MGCIMRLCYQAWVKAVQRHLGTAQMSIFAMYVASLLSERQEEHFKHSDVKNPKLGMQLSRSWKGHRSRHNLWQHKQGVAPIQSQGHNLAWHQACNVRAITQCLGQASDLQC
eukprot:scaffold316_cov25-Tisochrysis_lutea.AAC.1